MDRRNATLSALLDGSEADFENLVSFLPELDRQILRRHYWQGKSWQQVEDEMRYELRYLKRRAARALRQVEALIFHG